MEQNAEEEEMQSSGSGGVLQPARRCCDWFADSLDFRFLLVLAFECWLGQDCRRLLLIRNVI
jgi:hypothetical protein